MQTAIAYLEAKGRAARAASRALARASASAKNRVLEAVAAGLLARKDDILAANASDIADGRAAGLSEAMLDRVLLNAERIASMAADVRAVAALPDPIGEVFDMRTLPNGMIVGRKRVPLGVIGAIYENRPNVTVDIACLCLKSGNAVMLRSGSEAVRSSAVLAGVIQDALDSAGLPRDAVQFIANPDRALVLPFLRMKEYVDLMVPRGGADFIRFVIENAAMPVVAGGVGVCHTYVDRDADLDKAVAIAYNAKVQRPSVCNALDTLLVHYLVAPALLPKLATEWALAGVEMRCDATALGIMERLNLPGVRAVAASDDDWGTEFLALIASVKVVRSLDEALAHIERYGSGHSEAIVTESYAAAMRFLDEVDAAAVFANASTRFTDGGQFGLGAEVGISTQKFHARGPMGTREMTSYKWIVFGNGHVRP